MLGYVFGLISAACFGVGQTSTRRGVLKGTVIQAVFTSVVFGVPLFLIASAITGQVFHANLMTTRGFIYLGLAGVLHFIGGRYCNYRGIRAIGAARSASISTIQLPYSVVIAVIFLGEKLNTLMAFGILMVMIAPLIMVEQRRKERVIAGGSVEAPVVATGKESAPPIRQAEGYFFGVLAAIAYGTSPILIRSAVESNGLGIFGGFVSYGAAALVILVVVALPGGMRTFQSIPRKALPYFVLSTVMVFFAQMFRFAALAITSVTIVATLQRLSAVFTMVFSFIFNRHLENFNWRVIAGILLAVAGAVVLGLASGL